MKKILYFTLFAIITLALYSCNFINSEEQNPAAGKIPEPTETLVNDFAEIFSQDEVQLLEDKLYNLDSLKGVQILLVTTPDLGDYEISDYAQRIGDKWGVGKDGEDKGLVIVVKPKNETKGQAFIATGYGLEGVLPDVRCSRIVTEQMVPRFKEDKYYDAIVDAVDYITLLVSNEQDEIL